MRVTSIDHIAIVVDSIDEALRFYRDALGLPLTHTDVEEEQGVVVAFLSTGCAEIELIEPVDDASGVHRYLERRGPGLHHLCVEVDDLDQALEQLRAHDVRLIDETPHRGTGGRRIAFIHPKAAHGVLLELYETLPGDRAGRRLTDLGELRRRIVVSGHVAVAGTRGFLDSLRRSRPDSNLATEDQTPEG